MAEGKGYRGDRYWEREKPEVVKTERISWAMFPEAGKLQIRTYWQDDQGEHIGKVIVLSRDELTDEVIDLLARFTETG